MTSRPHSPYTDLPGVPDSKRDVRPGMAHYLASGPAGRTCGSCRWRGYQRLAKKVRFDKKTNSEYQRAVHHGGCQMYLKLSGDHGPPVRPDWAACKYFEEAKR